MTNPEIQRSCPLCDSNEIAVRGDLDRDIYVVDCPMNPGNTQRENYICKPDDNPPTGKHGTQTPRR